MNAKEHILLNWLLTKHFCSKLILIISFASMLFCGVFAFVEKDLKFFQGTILLFFCTLAANTLIGMTKENILYELDEGRLRNIDSETKKDIKFIRFGILEK